MTAPPGMKIGNMFSRLMGRKRPDILGIEIGTSAVKAVAVRPGGPPQLLGAFSAPIPSGTFSDGQVTEPARLAEVIKQMLSGLNTQKMQVVMGVPEQGTISRHIDVPRMSRKDLVEALPWEAERYLPYPIDEVNLDFHLQDDPESLPADGRMEVVVVAARKETVAQLREVANLAGLSTGVMDIKSFAAVRAVYAAAPELRAPSQTAVVVEVGAGSTNISLLTGGRLLMTRMVRIGADDFTTRLQEAFGLEFDLAEQLKATLRQRMITDWDAPSGAASDWDATPETPEAAPTAEPLDLPAEIAQIDPARAVEVLKPRMSDLTSEVVKSLEYYRTQARELTIDLVVVCGGGSRLVGLMESLQDAIGVSVAMADPWNALKGDVPLDPTLPDMTVPVGLALWGNPDA